MIANDLTGEYKGYDYWIDNNYVVHIGDKVGASFSVEIRKEKIGTSYFTVSAIAKSSYGEIIGYIYIVDGIATTQITQQMYTQSNLEPESMHTIKIIAIDDKGNQKTSNEMTIKTEPRVYLYNNGDECTSITGGWARGNYNTGSFTKYDTYMNLYADGTSSKSYNSCVTSNNIKLTDYTKILFEIEFDNAGYVYSYNNYWSWLYGGVHTTKEKLDYDSTDLLARDDTIYSTNESNIKKLLSIDITSLDSGYISFEFGRNYSGSFSVNAKIYSVWLEK